MPYNPAGLFSLVASYFATPGAEIRTEQHNPVFEDVASALSNVLLRDGRAPMTGPLNMNGQPINNVAVGSSSSSVATLGQAMPIGAVIDFAGSTAPAGWALCLGQSLNRATNAALFAVIGTTYGAPDASTFSLPDCRGRVVSMQDFGSLVMPGFAMGTKGGSFQQNIAQSQLPNVGIPFSGASGSVSVNSTSNNILIGAGLSSTTSPGPGAIFSLPGNGSTLQSISSTGSATNISGSTNSINSGVAQQPFFSVQPTIALNKIIRVSYDT